MTGVRILTENLRSELKKPLGDLLKGREDRVKNLLRKALEKEKPLQVIAVGDQTSKTLLNLGMRAHLHICDGKTKRKKIPKRILHGETVTVKNPAGVITDEALKAVKTALSSQVESSIFVDGEEDLLTLAAILYAPEGAAVLYGQPDEGIVFVKVTTQKRQLVKKIIDRMKVER
jgi:uncharacterized protein (UPF0218 family)